MSELRRYAVFTIKNADLYYSEICINFASENNQTICLNFNKKYSNAAW
jgi:hypothetical protein